jgi:hypothetical protein
MFLIVMVKPIFQPIHDGSRLWPVGQSDVVAFEGFNQAFGQTIALGLCTGVVIGLRPKARAKERVLLEI